jgi:hypothetical protein
VTVASISSSAPATSPWRSGTSQLRLVPSLTASLSPAGLTIESSVPEVLFAIRVTVSLGPT